jgi:hypothetical protein
MAFPITSTNNWITIPLKDAEIKEDGTIDLTKYIDKERLENCTAVIIRQQGDILIVHIDD